MLAPESTTCRANGTRHRAEGGGNDRDPGLGGSPFDLVELSSQRIEENAAGGSDAASQDHDLRIDHIDQGGDAAGQSPHGLRPDLGGLGIPIDDRSDEFLRRPETAATALTESALRNRVFETPGSPADVG